MSSMDIDKQKAVLVGRAQGLATNLEEALADVGDYISTITIVEKFVKDINNEFSTYVEVVKRATTAPGKPCPEGQIWCLPLMRCTLPEDCEQQYNYNFEEEKKY